MECTREASGVTGNESDQLGLKAIAQKYNIGKTTLIE